MGQRTVTREIERENPRVRPEGERATQERVPMHEQKSKMGVRWADPTEAEKYIARWVNETDQFGPRVPRLKLAGWMDVPQEAVMYVGAESATHTEDGGSFFRKQVGLDRHGTPVYARFMRIRKEWYDDDDMAKQGKIDVVEGQIKRTLQESEGDFYGDVNVTSRLHKSKRKF